MSEYLTLQLKIKEGFASIKLNRVKVKNALNEVMIVELTELYNTLNKDKSIRAIILSGNGDVFCSGADLNWMKKSAEYDYSQNMTDSLELAKLFLAIYESSKVTITIAHGAAYGGATGLMAASDIAIATSSTNFAFSEVKLGLIPSVISPYIIKRIGEFSARELMLTGRRFGAEEAVKMGLINNSIEEDKIDSYLEELKKNINSCGPKAIEHCKSLIKTISNEISFEESIDHTAKNIALIRVSEEGKEGIEAYLEKRDPSWKK